jgi:phospholipid/cholesterol/gamma-HCH transport system substrate-binding protein
MKKDWIAREMMVEIVVGVFVVLVFLGLAYFTILLSQEAWFSPKYTWRIQFNEVMGLRDGDKVVVRGMPVGKVKTLELQAHGVCVETALEEPIEIREGYAARVIATSILGGRYLEIDTGPAEGKRVPEGTLLQGEEVLDLMSNAAELVKAAKKSLVEEGTLDNLRDTSASLKEISERIQRGEGTVGKLLSADSTLYDDLSATVASLKQLTGRLENGEGTLGKLFSSDSTLHDDLSATVASLRKMTDRVEKGEGTLGRLLSSDDQLYKDLQASVASLKNITGQIEGGEGLLGRLLKDDSLYDDVAQAVQEVRGWIDDYRETSPVVSFTSVALGAF